MPTRRLLDALPAWFGIPEANDAYVAFADGNPTWSAVSDSGDVVGVLTEQHHGPESREIHLLAVHPTMHRHGVGRALVEAFEARALSEAVRLTHVKTLGPSHPDEGYAHTREFYLALGYVPMEETPELWDGTPALLMVKPLPPLTGEAAAMARFAAPLTTADVVDALRAAGMRTGGVAIVHSSLSQLGWVAGGGQAVLQALQSVSGPAGTLVMPAQTGYSDPAGWENPPAPAAWWPTIRDHMPAYDPALTPLRGMGAVVEAFHRLPTVRSSGHPATAFLAAGPAAEQVCAPHELAHGLDDESPLGRLYQLDAQVVLIGVGHANNTSLHLAEARATWPGKTAKPTGAAMIVDGERRWVAYDAPDYDDSDFGALGADFATTGHEQTAALGAGLVRVMPMRAVVDFAATWLAGTRR